MTYEELVSPLMEFFNQGADKQLGARRRDKDGNIEMTKWDHVTGRSQEELNKAAQKRLNNTEQAEEYRRLTGTTDDLPTSMRRSKLNSEVSRLEGVEDAKKAYLRTPGNQGRAAIEGMTADEIEQQRLTDIETKEEADALKPGGRIERMEESDRRYYDGLEAADKRFNATQSLAIAQMGLAQQQQANQMQIAQMNNQLERRRMDMNDRRTDRRDRQAYIQQLMAGLSTLGASIAI